MVDKIEQLNLEILEAYSRIRKVIERLPDLSGCDDPLYLAGVLVGEVKALGDVLSRIKVLDATKDS